MLPPWMTMPDPAAGGGGANAAFGGMGKGWGAAQEPWGAEPAPPAGAPGPETWDWYRSNRAPEGANPAMDMPPLPPKGPVPEPPGGPDIPSPTGGPLPDTDTRPPGPRDVPGRPGIPEPPGAEQPGGQVNPPTSIYDVYEQGRARMQEDANRAIEQAMATAGFSGNRYGSAAMNAAGEQQRRHELGFQDMFTNMLYNQGQSDLDRQLQAAMYQMQHQLGLQQLAQQGQLGQAGLSLQAEQLYNDLIRQQIQALFGMGGAETQRGDMWNQLGFNEWMQSRLGPLEFLLPLLTGSGGPTNPSGGTTFPSGGGNDWMDWLNAGINIWNQWENRGNN